MKWTDTVIAISTVAMTLATIAIGYLAYQTGGQAGAATTFSDAADRIDTKIGQAEKDFQAMADSSERSIEAAQISFRDDQRAWLTVSEVNLYFDPKLPQVPLGAQIAVVNVGKTPALHVTHAFSRFIWPPPRLSQPTPQLIKGLVFTESTPNLSTWLVPILWRQ
jgi:hypothetical protein